MAGFTGYSFFLQETEIDSIHQLVVGATENIKEGNEDIREVGIRAFRSVLAQHCTPAADSQQ